MRKISKAIGLGLCMAFAGCAGEGPIETDGEPGSSETVALRELPAHPFVSRAVNREATLQRETLAVAFLSPFAAALPRGLEVDAWHRVPGLETAALRNCFPGGDLLVTCQFALSGNREARVVYRVVDSGVDARFDCESRAGAGAAMVLDGGPNRWLAGRATFTATGTLCFSTEVTTTRGPDGNESFRVATALAAQMASPLSPICDGMACETATF